MAITKLTVENFKSFDKIEVELRPFNIVVGSNASGKSNFLDVFKFLRDIEASSLENAIGIRGGAETLRNFNLVDNQVLRICFETDDIKRRIDHIEQGRTIGMESSRTTYEFSIEYDESDSGYRILTDCLTEQFRMLEIILSDAPADSEDESRVSRLFHREVWDPANSGDQRSFGKGRASYKRDGDSIDCLIELPPNLPFTKQDLSLDRIDHRNVWRPQEVILEQRPVTLFLWAAAGSLASISAYDFDPRKAQLAVPPTGSRELDANAENLPVVLRDILRRPEAKKRLISLVSVLLPFVHDLDVDEFGFGQLITMLTERFSDKSHRLAAAFASDGTIACLALVVALYFQESAVAVFEEPDKHVYPHLASRVMQMMNEVTDETQVIVTTHNPELLRHANLDDILLVTRDSDGHSQITRPADSEVLSHFLRNELGVEDLFVQDLLAL